MKNGIQDQNLSLTSVPIVVKDLGIKLVEHHTFLCPPMGKLKIETNQKNEMNRNL